METEFQVWGDTPFEFLMLLELFLLCRLSHLRGYWNRELVKYVFLGCHLNIVPPFTPVWVWVDSDISKEEMKQFKTCFLETLGYISKWV